MNTDVETKKTFAPQDYQKIMETLGNLANTLETCLPLGYPERGVLNHKITEISHWLRDALSRSMKENPEAKIGNIEVTNVRPADSQ